MSCKVFPLLIPLLFLFVLFSASGAEQASFYGNSYITVPLEESKTHTDIYLKFKTRLSDTFIFLVAGANDYCKIDLDNGKLRVVFNLGSGEVELNSAATLNDFKWHEVIINRKEGDLSMVVDKSKRIQKKIPGKSFKFIIEYGLFVGDHKNQNNTDLFFGHITTFRGCLSEITYNGISVLEVARQRENHAIVEGITWNCAAEFDAPSDQPISFVEDDAFFVIPQKSSKQEIQIKMYIKSRAENGLLFYNPGFLKQDFLLLEIINYTLRATIKMSERVVTVSVNDKPVSDGQWNQIVFRLTAYTVELSVNDRTEMSKNGHTTLMQLGDSSYVGGLEVSRRSRAFQKGCSSACDKSFKGCIRGLTVTEQKRGLPDAFASYGLLPGCVWQYRCTQNPCAEDAVCLQRGIDSFQCLCAHPSEHSCVKQNYSDTYSIFSSLATDLELLTVEPLEALEGTNTIVTTTNLHMVLDYRKFGIQDAGVKFSVESGPEYGVLTVEGWSNGKIFTLLDVIRDKVRYVHDGSENTRDTIGLIIEFQAADAFTLPVYLQGKFKFVLIVNVHPKNDLPAFDMSESKVLRIVQGSKKLITSDLFKAEDPDNSPSELVYTIVNCDCGYFEHPRKVGVKVETFTQEDVNQKKIVFVHTGADATESFISLQVSDGIEASPVYKVRVTVTPQVWRLEKNTGLQLLHQTFSVITPQNLSYTSNVPNADNKVLFKIIKKPSHGDVEVERSLNNWEPTDVFSNFDLKQHRVRYRHVLGEPEFDEFQFRTALNKSVLYTFRLTFVECTLNQISSKILELNSAWEAPISSKSLSFESQPPKPLASITYQVIQYPEYGYLFSSFSKYRIKCFDNFTQEDINSENIRYRLHQKAFSDVTDQFVVNVKSLGCGNATAHVTIKYYPSNEDKFKVQVNIKQLDVEEGMSAVIDRPHLYINAKFVNDLVFNITTLPQHGFLQLDKDGILQNYTRSFSVRDLNENKVFYLHDGSETTQDQFRFMALSNSDETFQYVGQFVINVHLKNDHSPARVIDKVFQVVVGGEKLLTGRDLKYVDMDIGTLPSMIVYTCREIPNGQFFHLSNLERNITEFTQDDLDQNRILFKHKGPEYGKLRLWVTDGQFHVIGILEIQASGPFIYANINKKLIVETGKSVTLTPENLFYSTNLYTTDSKVFYYVISGPNYGKFMDPEKDKILKNFTQEDVNLNKVIYFNDLATGSVDEIGLKINCKDAVNIIQMSVLILPSSYWEPLQLKRLKKLTVEASRGAHITKDNLEANVREIMLKPIYNGLGSVKADPFPGLHAMSGANITGGFFMDAPELTLKAFAELGKSEEVENWVTQINVPSSIIMFHITYRPQHGYLTILSESTESKNGSAIVNVACFSQDLINENRVLYIQAGANHSRDTITFNVTNGLVWLPNIHLDILITPDKWYLGSSEVIVPEGGIVQISSVNLFVETDYYRRKPVTFKIMEKFKYGCILVYKQCTKSNSFTQNDLSYGIVEYAHDGSENLKDYAIIIAEAEDGKKSEPVKLVITVDPINDNVPKVVNNTGLEMWEGGQASITRSMLAATDVDRPKNTLRYHVQSCWWGNVTIETSDPTPVNYFTQDDIDKGLIKFNHRNGSRASFLFNVSDGEHKTKDYLFQIKTKKVQLKLLNNNAMHIFPLQKKTLTPSNLLAKISDGRPITYQIKKPPTLGRLMMKSKKREHNIVVSNFTQDDLNNDIIFYEHLQPFADLYANDSFVFDIQAYLATPLQNQVFRIDISVSSGGLDSYVQISKLAVDEGGLISIPLNLSEVVSFLEMHAGLHAPVIHVSAEAPQHGHLFLQNDKDNGLLTFTRQQLESGQVFYEHDNSDTLSDHIRFSLYLIPGYILLCNLTAHITVNPVNDQPFRLVTPAPIFEVVQGENHTITKEELCTEDGDTPPVGIKYDLVNGPSSGRLLLLPELEPVTHFTQADINKNRLVYIHESSILKDSFHLRIWDEKFKPEFTFFNIIVIPVTLSIKSGLPLQVRQGDSVGFLSDQNVFVETNADLNKIVYVVTHSPRNGLIYKDNNQTEKFTHNDLVRNRILYLQTDQTASNDTFQVTGQIVIGNLSFSQQFIMEVVIKPFMHIQDLIVKSDETTKITLLNLDASPLAKLTSSDPRYSLTYVPKFCEVKKLIRSSGQKKFVLDTVVNHFTHEELQGEMIYLHTKKTDKPLTDKIIFILAANKAQPAFGELKITVNPPTGEEVLHLPDPSDPESHGGDVLLTTANLTRDYVLIVTIVLALVVTTIVIVIIIKCKTMDRFSSTKEDVPLGTLPRPPERLLASPIKVIPPAAPPQCKVTPLGMTDFDEPSSQPSYPYGVGEEVPDDWSSIGNSSDQPSKSIMLRRNQYWV